MSNISEMTDIFKQKKDEAVDKVKSIGLTRGLELVAGVSALIGIGLVWLASNEDIIEPYENDIVEASNVEVLDDSIGDTDIPFE